MTMTMMQIVQAIRCYCLRTMNFGVHRVRIEAPHQALVKAVASCSRLKLLVMVARSMSLEGLLFTRQMPSKS